MEQDKQASAGAKYELKLLEEDDQFAKTKEERGLIEGTHYLGQQAEEFETRTLLYALKCALSGAGISMTNTDVCKRLEGEIQAHFLNERLIMTDRRLEQLGNLHSHHDTFLKESREALQLELFEIEERLLEMKEMKDKRVVDKKGVSVDVAEQLATLEADMKEIFALIAGYIEIFDNYKEAIGELKNVFNASQTTDHVMAARESRQGGAFQDKEQEDMKKSPVLEQGADALVDLARLTTDPNSGIDAQVDELFREMQLFHSKRADLNSRFDFIIQEIQKNKAWPCPQEYVPVKGDTVDESLAEFINEHGLGALLRRQAQGQYCFGTKKISCKILNNQLIVRVGGGYCHIEQFINQFAKVEMMKFQTRRAQIELQSAIKSAAAEVSSESSPLMRLTVESAGGLSSNQYQTGVITASATGTRSPMGAGKKSPRSRSGMRSPRKSPRMSTGGFSPRTVDKVINTHQFLKTMEQELNRVEEPKPISRIPQPTTLQPTRSPRSTAQGKKSPRADQSTANKVEESKGNAQTGSNRVTQPPPKSPSKGSAWSGQQSLQTDKNAGLPKSPRRGGQGQRSPRPAASLGGTGK